MTDCRQRWVLLHHQVDGLPAPSNGLGQGNHYDLMLSPPGDGQLWTWAIPINPVHQPLPLECKAERLPNHRRIYLDYQGPISGNRGHVQQAALGTFEVVIWSEQQVDVRLWLAESAEHKDSFWVSLTHQPSAWQLSWSAHLDCE